MSAEDHQRPDADRPPSPPGRDPREIVAEIGSLREEFARFPRGTVAFHVGLNALVDELLALRHYVAQWTKEHEALIEDALWWPAFASAPQQTAPLEELERLAREAREKLG